MSAPIQTYNDPQLYGISLTKPFHQSYQWMNEAFRSLPPECNLITECAMRGIKLTTGMLAVVLTALPALVGRAAQILHFHTLPVEMRAHRPSSNAQQEFFQTNVLVNLTLQCLDYQDNTRLARVNKLFEKESFPAAKKVFKQQKVVSLSQMIEFAAKENKGVDSPSFEHISADLEKMTELDLSNWDFADKSYERLSSLTPERRMQIESLNFSSAKNLNYSTTFELLRLLLASPKLNYFNFSGTGLNNFHELSLSALVPSLQNGRATWISSMGNKYVGNWVDGKLSGQGTLTFANGNKYVGNWANGKPSGQGTLTFANGDKYEGNWVDGKENGQGTDTYANGAMYEGNWVDGKRSGQGTYTYANGDKFVENWANGFRIGDGVYIYADGTEIRGHFIAIMLKVSFYYQVQLRIANLYKTVSSMLLRNSP